MDMLNQYVKSELIILVPVLYLFVKILNKSKLNNKYIPLVTTVISIFLCGLYIFSQVAITSWQCLMSGLFSTVTQGILIAGTSLFGGMTSIKGQEQTEQEKS